LQAYVLVRSSRQIRREVVRSPNPAARETLRALLGKWW
jgi:hypothetical protein